MKKLIINLLIIIALISNYACEERLELSPVSSITSASFWKTESDAIGALNGMYNQLRLALNEGDRILYWNELRTGFYTNGNAGGAGSINNVYANNMDATMAWTSWTALYTLINDCNLILKYVPDIPFSNVDTKKEVLGHAYFCRAYAYFKLAQIWGDVPIVTEGFESVSQELYNPRLPVAEAYALVKEDIDKAVDNLPKRAPGVTPWLASKDAANMLKTEIYLWIAKRAGEGATALSVARTAIDDVLLSSFILESNFENTFRQDNSKEIIFSIYFDQTEEYKAPTARDKGQYGTNFINNVNQVPVSLRSTIPNSGMTQWFILSNDFINRYLKAESVDQRTAVSWKSVVPSGGGNPIKWINKYIGSLVAGTRLFYDDTRIYRMAEAYMFKAEIENALDNKDVAITNLNIVAKRAYKVDNYYPHTLTKAQADSVILAERLQEFVAEGKSWFDIIRFGKAFEIITPLIGREADKQGNILLSPVNVDVISRNSTKITQTPGY